VSRNASDPRPTGALLFLFLLFPSVMEADVYAVRIDEQNAPSVLVAGPDAEGGVGDFAFGNGTLCGVVSDPSRQNNVTGTGGLLIDLGHCGRSDDQLLLFDHFLNLSRRAFVGASTVEARATAKRAQLVARGERDGLRLETTYSLDLADAKRVRVVSRLERSAEGERLFAFGPVVPLVGSLRPFTLSRTDPSRSRGFRQVPYLDRGASGAARAAVAAEHVVAVVADGFEPAIAYGLELLSARLERSSGETLDLPRFLLADESSAFYSAIARPFWIGDGGSLGLLQLLQTRLMDLALGDAIVVETAIRVGDRADVAAVTDGIFAGEPVLRGSVDDPSARIHVDRADGAPVSEVAPGEDGSFSLRLPRGEYALRVRAPGGREVLRSARVDADVDLGALHLEPAARVALPSGQPMRLVFLGEAGTRDPRLHDDLLGFDLVGEEGPGRSNVTREVHLAGADLDPEWVIVPPGRYRVLATRGPEFSVTTTAVDARSGETVRLVIDPPGREVETPGWISADFHVHAAPSPDSVLALDARVASYAAEGAEVLISTDHDMVTDYAGTIRALGLGGHLASVIGVEVTSEIRTVVAPYTIGHANAFPLPYLATAHRRGAPPDEGRRWREILADLRALPGARVIQLNHPRRSENGLAPRAFFTHLGSVGQPFDPTRPLDAAPNSVLVEPDPATGLRDIDFDAIELLNGRGFDAHALLREDWFSLLRQGVVLTGTANSDSHSLKSVVAAPRNYVRVPDDRASHFNEEEFVRAIRSGRTFGTTGPLVDLALGDASIGERFSGGSGVLTLGVQAASWIPVSTARIYVNGFLAHALPVAAGERLAVPLRFERDSFVTAEVEGSPSETYTAVLPGFKPLAFTNPIFVDADADGTWTPPGMR
jgi:hypothetical protein